MKLALVIPIVLMVTGCVGNQFEDLEKFVNNAGQDMRGKVEKLNPMSPSFTMLLKFPTLLNRANYSQLRAAPTSPI
jgi:Tfp pilus assembly protein PilP